MAARSPRRPESDSEAKAWFTAFEEGLQKLFVRAPAVVACSRSVWHEIIDTVIEGPARTAADEIAEYLARHPYDLSPTLRIELERRHVSL